MTQHELLNQLNPNTSLNDIQEYIKKVIDMRGFGEQSVQTALLLFLEETGELAKAVRKNSSGMSVDMNRLHNYNTIEGEVADVLIVLLSICNTLGINVFNALLDKEKINCERNWNINKKS
jgi:NTP pyrophosphatase (non-canonical NTP hydrolase)